jgi:hypothetical protein
MALSTHLVQTLPLLRAPRSWPLPLVASACMLLLAGLDIVGAICAKEWAEHRSYGWLGLGLGAFLLLFYLYASSLQYAELATVTLGWIVVLQIALVLIDRMRYGVQLPADKVGAVVLILVLQGYLMLAPGSSA